MGYFDRFFAQRAFDALLAAALLCSFVVLLHLALTALLAASRSWFGDMARTRAFPPALPSSRAASDVDFDRRDIDRNGSRFRLLASRSPL